MLECTRIVGILPGGSKDPVGAWVEGDHMESYQRGSEAGRTALVIS
jgi:hypothetical protein